VVRTQEFATQVAGVLGINLAAVQAAPTVHLTLMILIFEIICWPQASKNVRLGLKKAAEAKAAERPDDPITPTSLAVDPEPEAIEQEVRKALPAPKREVAITVRAQPNDDWQALLSRLDFPPFPPAGRHKGPLRAKEAAWVSAMRFLTWMGAFKESGHYPQDDLDALYAEFCVMDHREAANIKTVRTTLSSLPARVVNRPRSPPGVEPLWTITPPSIDKMLAMLEKSGLLETPEQDEPDNLIAFPKAGGDAA
jgi:hypothetical protein